uniref:Uncharacterized protein n=1 Tax=Rhabditophanes sp. KR3021 TaxID=114890 RepID=A0AC35U3A9_9BILA
MDASKKKTNDKVRAGKVQKNKDKKEQMITVKKLADIVGSNDDSSELEVVQMIKIVQMRFMFLNIFLLYFTSFLNGQINFGTLNLGKNPHTGDFEFGLNQFANILGFGGDNGMRLNAGKGRFGLQGGNGGLVGNERIGTNSGIGIDPNSGFNMGSLLNFGNQPSNPGANQLNAFLSNVGSFFKKLAPPAIGLPPPMVSPAPFALGVTPKSASISPELQKKFEKEDYEDRGGKENSSETEIKEGGESFATLVPSVDVITSTSGAESGVEEVDYESSVTDSIDSADKISSSIDIIAETTTQQPITTISSAPSSVDKDLIDSASSIDGTSKTANKQERVPVRGKKRRGPPPPDSLVFIDDKDGSLRRKLAK